MKLIHTADWHIGQSFYNYDRCDEAAMMMRSIAAIAADERPDLLLISGDIFHTAMPSAAAQRTWAEGVLAIHEACPTMTTVVISGNHDSPSRLGAYSSLWHLAGVHIVTPAMAGKPIVVGDEETGAVVVPVPFVPSALAGEMISRAVSAAREISGRRPIILMAHQAVEGLSLDGHHHLPDVAMDYISIDSAVQDAVDYIALGHIHKPQEVLAGKARYSGSPMPVHFDEAYYSHGVDIVTIDRHGEPATVRQVPVPLAVPLLTVPEAPTSLDNAIAAMNNLPDTTCYVRLHIDGDNHPLPLDAKQQALNASQATIEPATSLPRKRFCDFKVVREAQAAQASGLREISVSDIETIDITEVMERYLSRTGAPALTADEHLIINNILSEQQ